MIEKEVSEIMGSGQFNDKLDKLLQTLIKEKTNIKRPFIIIGNYTPTGESLTFVNYKYGTVRGNIRLISTTRENDYQEGCRENYMDGKFIENDPNWFHPEKYLIGPKQYIDNCLSYEHENDARIDDFASKSVEENGEIIVVSQRSSLVASKGHMAIPVKIQIDRSHPEVERLLEIMKKVHRTHYKQEFMNILRKCVEDPEIDCDMCVTKVKNLIGINLHSIILDVIKKKRMAQKRVCGNLLIMKTIII